MVKDAALVILKVGGLRQVLHDGVSFCHLPRFLPTKPFESMQIDK